MENTANSNTALKCRCSPLAQPGGYIIFETERLREMRRDVFQAIADPTRREILKMIAKEPLNVNSVAENFDVSRTAIYKHIKILIECGLVDMHQKGRERYCEAKPERLKEVSDWVEQYKQFWTTKLDSLELYLNKLQTGETKTGKKKSTARGNTRK
jgi:DNA-binding transcriptional ArsR family regulator